MEAGREYTYNSSVHTIDVSCANEVLIPENGQCVLSLRAD